MEGAQVETWRIEGKWIGWEVVDDGKAVMRIPKGSTPGGQMEAYNEAQAFANDLNSGGARRERRLRELEEGHDAAWAAGTARQRNATQ